MSSAGPKSASLADQIDNPFWEGLARDELLIQRCLGCRTWTWPPQWRCGCCGSWTLDWEPVPKRGVVFSYCRTRHVFGSQMQDSTPYTSLLVALPEAGGARLLGMLIGSDQGLEIDAPVEGVVDSSNVGPVLRWRLASSDSNERQNDAASS